MPFNPFPPRLTYSIRENIRKSPPERLRWLLALMKNIRNGGGIFNRISMSYAPKVSIPAALRKPPAGYVMRPHDYIGGRYRSFGGSEYFGSVMTYGERKCLKNMYSIKALRFYGKAN